MSEAAPILALSNVAKAYTQADGRLTVLKDVTLAIQPGEMVALVGPSGCGKSTLLHIAGLLDRPSAGDVAIRGEACRTLSDAERSALRRRRIGVVYQYHHLLPEFTALENVMMPQLIAGVPRAAARGHARELLDAMGLAERLTHRPAKLSGGEQQRVAIARAVANGPSLLLADEPTGNLDPATAERVFAQLHRLVHAVKLGALVATHNFDLARRMDRILKLHDGAVVPAPAL
jgi:lipoprotein-releasing system ATP-binding protein